MSSEFIEPSIAAVKNGPIPTQQPVGPGQLVETADSTRPFRRPIAGLPADHSPAAQEPAKDAAPRIRAPISRSDRISYHCAGLIFALLLMRFGFPNSTHVLAVEMRFLLALFAGCFVLGISGWFPGDDWNRSKLEAIVTLVVVFGLVYMLDLWLSGGKATIMAKVGTWFTMAKASLSSMF